jgi:glycosyltransferase involved in cell wall biosynthesis
MRVLFLVPYPLEAAPSQRFRFEQYFDILEKEGIEIKVEPFLSQKTWNILYQKGNLFSKVWGVLVGFLKRYVKIPSYFQYDYIFIHREAEPFGLPIIEWLLAKVLRKRIIYDFDDAIWLKNTSESNKLFSFFKLHNNTSKVCKWAYKVSCGNAYLEDYARQFNRNIVINPTTIDTENYHNREKLSINEKTVIGWTGSHSTVSYLTDLLPVFKQLEQKYEFELNVISDIPPPFELKSLKFTKWNKKSEIDDLLHFDVGIMPLKDDQWSNGKCGFKALQYMALGIPALVSPVGVNIEIVDDGLNGFICSNQQEWIDKLGLLLADQNRLAQLSKTARQKIIDNYSVKSNTENFIKLFS